MKQKHNTNLDILRWIAAFTVVVLHLMNSGGGFGFDKKYSLANFIPFNPPGHLSVLVFFVLSGYVISYSSPALSNKKEILDYAKKRLVRILPICIIVVSFVTVLTWGKYSVPVILSNMFCLSVPFDNVMDGCSPLWSLNYELLYYFLYIAIAYFNVNLKILVRGSLALVLIIFAFTRNVVTHPLFLSYLIGIVFWASGAMIAKYKSEKTWSIKHSRLFAIFGLYYCVNNFNPYGPMLKVLHIKIDYNTLYSWYYQSLSFNELFFLPVAILLIVSLTHQYYKSNLVLLWFTFGFAFFRLAMIIKLYGLQFLVDEHFVVPVIILVASLILWVANFNIGGMVKSVIKSSAAIGSISYAIYITHFPLLLLFGKVEASSLPFFLLKLTAFFATLFAVSYLLEIKFQPVIRRLLIPRKAVSL